MKLSSESRAGFSKTAPGAVRASIPLTAFLIAAIFAVFAVSPAQAQETWLRHHVEGIGEIPLILNPEKIGVRFEKQVPISTQAAVLVSESALDPWTQWEIIDQKGTAIVAVKPGASPSAVVETLSSLAATEQVYCAMPVVQTKPGYDALVTDEFYVSLPWDTPETRVEELNAVQHVETTKIWDLKDIHRKGYWLRTTKGSSLNALAMADLYYEQLGACGASPNFVCLYDTLAGAQDPNDEFFAGDPDRDQYYLKEIHVANNTEDGGSWEYTHGDPHIIVAVLDTGVEISYNYYNQYTSEHHQQNGHPDLVPNQWTDVDGTGTAVDPIDFLRRWDPLQNIWVYDPFDNEDDKYPNDFYGWNPCTTPDNSGADIWRKSVPEPYALNRLTPGTDASKTSAHGANCAGIIAGVANNGIGVAGIAGGCGSAGTGIGEGNGCRIMAVRVFESPTAQATDLQTVADGIEYTAKNGAHILSMSIQFFEWPSYLQTAVTHAREKDCVLVSAAGNFDQARPAYPGAAPEVICVGGSNRIVPTQRKYGGNTGTAFPPENPDLSGPLGCCPDGRRIWGSCWGREVDIMAPSVSIITTDITGEHGLNNKSGTDGDYTGSSLDPAKPNHFGKTSSATPQVAGVAALLLSDDLQTHSNKRTLSSAQVQAILEFSATDLDYNRNCDELGFHEHAGSGRDIYTGYGLVNARAALELSRSPWHRFENKDQKCYASFDQSGDFICSGMIVQNLDLDLDSADFSQVPAIRVQNAQKITFVLINSSEFQSATLAPGASVKVPAGSVLMKGKLYERVDVDDLGSVAEVPEPRIPYQAGSVTVGAVNTASFVNSRIDQHVVVPAGSLLVKGRVFIGGDPDRISSLEEHAPCDYTGLSNDPQTGQGPRFARAVKDFLYANFPDWDTLDLEQWDATNPQDPEIPDMWQMALVEYALCQPEGIPRPEGDPDFVGVFERNRKGFLEDVGYLIMKSDNNRVLSAFYQTPDLWAAMLGVSLTMKAKMNALIVAVCGEDLPSYAEYEIFSSPLSGLELFSHDADLDADGLSNLDEYWQTYSQGIVIFVSAATDPLNRWRQDAGYTVPVGAPAALTMLAVIILASASLLLRRSQRIAPAPRARDRDSTVAAFLILAGMFLCPPSAAVWQQVTTVPGWAPRYGHVCVTFNGNLWLMGGGGGDGANDVWRSEDGVHWTEVVHNAPWKGRISASCVVFDGKVWIFGGFRYGETLPNDVWSSSDGVHWTQASENTGWGSWRPEAVLAYDNKIWAIGPRGQDAEVWSSPNGVNWALVSAGPPSPYVYDQFATVFDAKMWVLGGWYGDEGRYYTSELWYSTDGATWTRSGTAAWPGRGNAKVLLLGERLWVLGGDQGYGTPLCDAWYSTDGNAWTRAAPDMPWADAVEYQCVVHDNALWAVGGRGAVTRVQDVWSSADGAVWTPKTSGAAWGWRDLSTVVAFNDAMWVLGGVRGYSFDDGWLNDVWRSVDGLNWTQLVEHAGWCVRYGQRAAAFCGKLWVLGGACYDGTRVNELNDVWYSPDGITWTQAVEHAPWEPRINPLMLSHAGRLWLFGGSPYGGSANSRFNDIWSTVNGVDWVQAPTPSVWLPRLGFGLASYGSSMWVLGGLLANTFPPDLLSDVWSSPESVNWTQVAANSPWSPRGAPRTFVHDGKLWIVGGGDASYQALSDAWYTTDGVNWTLAASAGPWARYAFAPAEYNGKMWMYGHDQVWSSTNGLTFDFTELPVGGWKEAGRPLTLTVGAPEGVTYQWYKYGAVIPDATDSTYTIPSLEPDDTGAYSCIVANADDVRQQTPPALIQVFPEGSLPVATIPGLLLTAALSLCAGVFLTQRSPKRTFFQNSSPF